MNTTIASWSFSPLIISRSFLINSASCIFKNIFADLPQRQHHVLGAQSSQRCNHSNRSTSVHDVRDTPPAHSSSVDIFVRLVLTQHENIPNFVIAIIQSQLSSFVSALDRIEPLRPAFQIMRAHHCTNGKQTHSRIACNAMCCSGTGTVTGHKKFSPSLFCATNNRDRSIFLPCTCSISGTSSGPIIHYSPSCTPTTTSLLYSGFGLTRTHSPARGIRH